ncbi:MAG: hypothetical protein ACJ76X_17210 [Solirubrobacteraceae bacterium]|jgi:hypothetical protein
MARGGQSSGRELLERFVPVLRYDSNEAFFADAVELMAGDNDAFELTRESGAKIETGQASATFLAAERYPNGEMVQASDRLAARRRDYREQAAELHPQPGLRNVVYGHTQHDSEDRLWLQYWYFYLYNDAGFAGNIGLHEGDWEMVQLRMAGDEPDLAVYAQHDYSEAREFNQVQCEGLAPIVYPGRGTHASYFEPGLHRTAVWWDIVDGMRPAPPLRLVVLDEAPPSWLDWPGHWGATQPRIPFIDSWSPVGPAQHEQWQDPKKLAAKARGHEPQALPPAPKAHVHRRLGNLVVHYDVSVPVDGLDRSDRLVLTVNSPDEQGPPQTYTFSVDDALRGRIVTTRQLDPGSSYEVRTSIVDRSGVGTAVVRTSLRGLGPLGRLLARLHSILHDLRLARRWA